MVSLTTHRGSRHTNFPQFEKTLVRGVMIDISIVAIHQALFGPDYTSLVSTVEYDFKFTLHEIDKLCRIMSIGNRG